MLVVGIDVGGTKAVCWLANQQREVIADMRGMGATLQAGGDVAVEHVLRQVLVPAMHAARAPISAVCVGMAGVDRPEEAGTVRAMIERLTHVSSLLVVNDALIALEAGISAPPGIVIVAGTGSIAYGRDTNGRAARAGGWGYVLGDEGSGYWMGRRALQAVVRAADGRGPATALTPLVLERFGVRKAQDLVQEVYFHLTQPAAIAGLSGLVNTAAADGDPIAIGILDASAEELSSAALAVARQLSLDACPVLLSGGVFRSSSRLTSCVTSSLTRALPRVTVDLLKEEPVAGAVKLALALAAGKVEIPKYENRT